MPANFLNAFDRYPNLVYGYSTKGHGNMSYLKGPTEAQVDANRAGFARELKVDVAKFIMFPHTGSSNIAILKTHDKPVTDRKNIYRGGGKIAFCATDAIYYNSDHQEGIDAIISNKPDLYPMMLTGDCVTIGLYDDAHSAYGLVHAGMLGCVNRLMPNALQQMALNFNTQAKDIEAVIFPSLRACHYDVQYSGLWQSIGPSAKKYYGHNSPYFLENKLDMHLMLKDQMQEFGMAPHQIHDTELCTACHDSDFYSNYMAKTEAEKRTVGRFASLIGIRH